SICWIGQGRCARCLRGWRGSRSWGCRWSPGSSPTSRVHRRLSQSSAQPPLRPSGARQTIEARGAPAVSWEPRELSFSSGGVEVYVCDGERQLWRVPAGSEEAISLLLELGAAGVGGFESSGRDARGAWLGRQLRGVSLAEFWSRTEPDWQLALALGGALARALAACERHGLWPGPLHPTNAFVD